MPLNCATRHFSGGFRIIGQRPLLHYADHHGATQFIQQKMTPSTGDPNMAKMMLIMPIVFTFIFLNFRQGWSFTGY